MKLTDEEKKMCIDFGALNYNAVQISNLLGKSIADVKNDLKDVESDLFKSMKIGKDRFEYVMDKKLLEMAQSGDLKALARLEMRRAQRS